MRTTLEIDDDLLADARQLARERGATIGQIISELARLQACVDKASATVGAGDAAALERVRLVATGLEYTKKTRDLLAAAAAVRAGKSTAEEFHKIKAGTDRYYSSLRGSLAVTVSRDIQSCLSLTPERQK